MLADECAIREVSGAIHFDYDATLRLSHQTIAGAEPLEYRFDQDGLLLAAGPVEITYGSPLVASIQLHDGIMPAGWTMIVSVMNAASDSAGMRLGMNASTSKICNASYDVATTREPPGTQAMRTGPALGREVTWSVCSRP